MSPDKVTIIGAGIGGLTLGNTLQEKGIEVEYFEQASEFRVVGSGITVQPNALEVLERLGLRGKFLEIGANHSKWHAIDKEGKTIFQYTFPGHGTGGAHRASLHKVLRENIANISIEFNKKCIDIAQDGDSVTIEFADGTEYTTENPVIAADGTYSTVRETLFPDVDIESSGQLCHRGLPKDEPPEHFHEGIFDVWAGDFYLGMTPFGRDEGLGYLFFTRFAKNTPSYACPDELVVELPEKADEPYNPTLVKEHMLDLVVDTEDYVTEIIESIPAETIVTVEMTDIPYMDTWTSGKVTLLGDAAHPMTAYLAQGGAMAMEDALVLANCLSKYDSYQRAFLEYENLRIERAYKFVNMSREVGVKMNDPSYNAVEEFRTLSQEELQELFGTSIPDHEAYKL